MSNNSFFKLTFQDKKTNARLGLIETPHGKILTPSFIPVGTNGTVKTMSPEDLKILNVDIFFVNTYHLYLNPGFEIVEKLGGLHNFISWNRSLITDSGGFQVYSLARSKNFAGKKANIAGETETLCKINDDGVIFKSHRDGSIHKFTPEFSIKIQKKLGADIILCFDECTYYPATYEYSKKSMERTHRWAIRCLEEFKKSKKNKQVLYGIIQGGTFKDLREKSARFISGLPFDGIAIGGVSVGESKKEMRNVLDWTIPLLPSDKPRHLLGVGEIDDIFELIGRGIDTFDCVIPTRLGRMGHALITPKIKMVNSKRNCKNKGLVKKWTIDITKKIYKDDKKGIDSLCKCYVCQNFSRAYINHLFRNSEILGYRLLTFHNLYFITSLVRKIRKAIKEGNFIELKNKWLNF